MIHAANAPASALIDGVLTVALLVAYLLSRGYTAWTTRASDDDTPS